MNRTFISRVCKMHHVVTVVCVIGYVQSFAATVAPPVNDEEALDGQLKRLLLIYARAYTTPSFGDYVPTPDEIDTGFMVTMAANEYEPLQVGLHVSSNGQLMADVRIEVQADLPFQVGFLRYARDFDRRHDVHGGWSFTKWHPIDKGRPYTRYSAGRHALPLYVLPGDTIPRIAPGQSSAFWITFRTDAGTPA